MESDEIKLVIKAPNQNIDDQTIDCNLDWTIERLKDHLFEVYPFNPDPKEQKIIYSGRLLRDHLQLKDILRHEDRQTSIHTFHLVCSHQTNPISDDENGMKSSQTASQTSDSDGYTDDSDDQDYTDSSQRSQSRTSTPANEFASTDHVHDAQPTAQSSDLYNQMIYASQMYMNYIAQGQSYGASAFQPFSVPPDVAAQMTSYQQMYSNYYYQYLQNYQTQSSLPAGQSTINYAEAVAAAMQNPPPRNVMMNAQGGHIIDDHDHDHDNRDWLDYFYLCCRGFVLFSIVYFYSSPERLMLVIGLAFLALLYQEGWILARARNNRIREHRLHHMRERAQAAENHNTDDAPTHNEDANNREQHINEIEAIMDGDDPPHVHHHHVVTNHNPAWTFISSFFSSLIPEPPAPVNIN